MTPAAPPGRRALVVFSGQADLPWLRLLRPGFRHCFVVLDRPGGWVAVNAMAHRTDITVLPALECDDLAALYRAQGLRVIETVVTIPPKRPAGWRPYSCVEESTRILGLSRYLIFTPWQLYRFLVNSGKKSLTSGAIPPRVAPSTPQLRP